MLYTIKEFDPCIGDSFEHGVFTTFEEGMRFKYDPMDSVVPVSDEKARKLILGELYEAWNDDAYDYEYNEEDGVDAFDDDVARYIDGKRPGWELLLDYDPEKDNLPLQDIIRAAERHKEFMRAHGFPFYPLNFDPNE